MKKSYNDMDKLMQLALYMIPKYVKRIEKYNKNYIQDKDYSDISPIDENKIIDIIEKKLLNENSVILKGIDGSMDKKEEKIGDSKKNNKKNKDNKKNSIDGKDQDKNDEKIDDNSKKMQEEPSNSKCIGFNRCSMYCKQSMKRLLMELSGEKVDLCIEDIQRGLINEVVISEVRDNIIKVINRKNQITIIPIHNIVGIYSESLPFIDIYDDFINKDDKEIDCSFEEDMRNYFKSILGKKVAIQTRGDGKFRYIYEKNITNIGIGFVVVDNTMAISFCNINFVKEL